MTKKDIVKKLAQATGIPAMTVTEIVKMPLTGSPKSLWKKVTTMDDQRKFKAFPVPIAAVEHCT